jgi:hypothetical protein
MVRIDAPFGLPLETLRCFEVQPSWLAMADWLVAFGSPRLWRGAIRQTVRKEPRRLCDEQFRTPMAPMNLRVFKQTWTLIAEVLKPLVDAGVRIEPVHAAASSVTVCEGCPASLLRMKGWPDHGYKGQGEPPRAVRADLMRRMYRERIVVTTDMEAAAIDDVEGDLLDALLLTLDPLQWVPPSEARVEALVKAGVDAIVVDTAHGHSQGVIDRVRWVKQNYPHIDVIGGNIATGAAALALVKAGADAVAKAAGVLAGGVGTTAALEGDAVADALLCAPAKEPSSN